MYQYYNPVTVVCNSWGASYDGRAAVPSISREGVTQKSCRVTATQSIINVTEQSAYFGHGGVIIREPSDF